MCTKFDGPNQKDSVLILFTRFNNIYIWPWPLTPDLGNQQVLSSFYKKYVYQV